MNKTLFVVAVTLAIVFSLLLSISIYASNNTSQEASTDSSTSINIVGKLSTSTAVTSIIFPKGSPGSTISNPYNNVNGISDPQVLSDANSEPVVRLYNYSSTEMAVTLEITGWTGSVVASERYELKNNALLTVSAVEQVLSSNGSANTVETGVALGAGEVKDLYLEITLGSTGGASGASTLTVLGQS